MSEPSLWRLSPHTYAEEMSGGKWICCPWLRVAGDAIADAIMAGDRRLMIWAPTRHGKSKLLSHWTPVWFLDNWPDQRVILTSYGAALAEQTFGAEARNEIQSNPRVSVKLRQDSRAKGCWNTTQNGGMISAGIGGPIEGRGFNLGIIDDPYETDQDAHSLAYNRTLWGWYDATFSLRAEPNATVIVAMARWTDWDFCAALLKAEPGRWKVLRFPAIAEEDDPAGRAPGEALFPERYSVEQLEVIKRDRGRSTWQARLQQSPELDSDRLYSAFSNANIDDSIQIRHDLPLSVTWDFNVNPGCHVELFQYDNNADTFYVLEEFHGPRMDVKAACAALREWIRARCGWQSGGPSGTFPWRELHVFGDATGSSKWAGTGDSCYDILQRALSGIPHRVRRGAANPPVIDRINTVNDALRDSDNRVRVKITSKCIRLIDDFRSMKPDAQGLEDKSESKLSHASSALGYAICYLRPLWKQLRRAKGGGRFG